MKVLYSVISALCFFWLVCGQSTVPPILSGLPTSTEVIQSAELMATLLKRIPQPGDTPATMQRAPVSSPLIEGPPTKPTAQVSTTGQVHPKTDGIASNDASTISVGVPTTEGHITTEAAKTEVPSATTNIPRHQVSTEPGAESTVHTKEVTLPGTTPAKETSKPLTTAAPTTPPPTEGMTQASNTYPATTKSTTPQVRTTVTTTTIQPTTKVADSGGAQLPSGDQDDKSISISTKSSILLVIFSFILIGILNKNTYV